MDSIINLLVTIFIMGLVVFAIIFGLLWGLLMCVINTIKGFPRPKKSTSKNIEVRSKS